MRGVFVFIFVIVLPSTALWAVELKWAFEKDKRIEMVKTARVKYYVNANLNKIYDERNVIDLTCTGKSDKYGHVNGVFTVHEKGYGESLFRQREKFTVDFLIANNGTFVVKSGDYMPNLRNIPSFPEGNLDVGKSWKSNGELIINSFSRPFKITFPVEYSFVKMEKDRGLDIAIINYSYFISMNMAGQKLPADFPVRITGKNNGIIYWDVTNNRPKDIQDFYKIAFVFYKMGSKPASAEFHMNIKTKNTFYDNFTPSEKEKARDELKKEVPKGMDVDLDKRGLVVRMGDLLFDFDSDKIRADTKEKLNKIAEILKRKYPDREIIVEGHTDDVGEKKYNYSLSERRAKGVSSYLMSKLNHDKLSYKGYGSDKPLVEDKSKEGRQKNRRVEIIIKLN